MKNNYMKFIELTNLKGTKKYIIEYILSIDEIDKRTKRIGYDYYLHSDFATMKGVGNKYSISKERVRQLLHRFIKKINKITEIIVISKTKITERPISYLNLNVKTESAICGIGVNKIGDILKLSEFNLLNIKGIGIKRLKEIKDVLKENNLSIKTEY